MDRPFAWFSLHAADNDLVRSSPGLDAEMYASISPASLAHPPPEQSGELSRRPRDRLAV